MPVQAPVVAAAFGVEAWIAWMRRDSVALRAFSVAAGIGLLGAVGAVVWAGNALLLAGLALLHFGVRRMGDDI